MLKARQLTQAAHEPAQTADLVLVFGAKALKGLDVLAAHAQGMRRARPPCAVYAEPVALLD